jgi:hypothetical protein
VVKVRKKKPALAEDNKNINHPSGFSQKIKNQMFG